MAQRLNKRFLLVTAAVVVGGVGTVMGLQKLIVKDRPDRFIAQYGIFMAQGRYQEAIGSIARASALDPKNPELLLKMGDAYYALTAEDPDAVGKDRTAWERALEVDPNYVPAMIKLLYAYMETSQTAAVKAGTFERIRELAQKISAINKDDTRMRAYIHIAPIQQALQMMGGDPQLLDASVAALQDLMKKDPENPELPYYVARALIFKGQNFQQNNRTIEAQSQFAEAGRIMDEALKINERNALMNFRTWQIYSLLQAVEIGSDAKRKYTDRIHLALDHAQSAIKPTDTNYFVEINVAAGNQALIDGEGEKAERIFHDLYEQRPNDPNVRLLYARYLSRTGKRDKAIEILSSRPGTDDSMKGLKQLRMNLYELATLVDLTNMRMDAYSEQRDPAQKDALMNQIQDGLSKIVAKRNEADPTVLRLRGKLQLLQNNAVEATVTLSRLAAIQMPLDQDRDEVCFMLAKAYFATNQTGEAKKYLIEVLERHEKASPARMLLAQLYIAERDFVSAKHQIDILQTELGETPDVIRLRIACLDREKDADQIKELYTKLSEKTPEELRDKINVSIAINDLPDAARLADLIRLMDKGDPEASMTLTRIYWAMGRQDEARKTVNEAVAANPNHAGLRLLKLQLTNPSTEVWFKALIDEAETIKEPYPRAIKLAEIYRDKGDEAQMIAKLKEAEKLKPGDGDVAEKLFRYYVNKQDWDATTPYMDLLIKLNKDQAHGLLYKFILAMAKKEYNNAIQLGRQLTQERADYAESWLSLAKALVASGQIEEALSRYEVALEKQPKSQEALQGKISCYYGMGRTEDAKRAIDQALKVHPEDMNFQEQLINYNLSYGDPELALPPRQKALNNNPDQPFPYLALAQAYLRCAQMKASVNKDLAGKYLGSAWDTCEAAIKKWPEQRAFYAVAGTAAIVGNAEDKGEKLIASLVARPSSLNNPEPHMLMADFYARTGKADEAIKSLRAAFQIAPNNIALQLDLVNLLARTNHVEEALKTLSSNPDDARVQKRRIELLINTNQLQQAENDLGEMIKKDNARPADFLSLLGFVYMHQHRFDDAVNTLNKAIAIDPKHVWAGYYLAIVRLSQPKPDPDEAIRLLLPVRETNPDNVEIRMALAEAYSRSNDADSTIRELESALRMSPTNKDVRSKLFNLYMASKPPRYTEAQRIVAEVQVTPEARNDPDWPQAEALLRLQRKDYTGALESSMQARRLAPSNPNIYRTFLRILLESGHPERIIEETDPLVKGKTGVWWIYPMRAIARKAMKDIPGALAEYDAALVDADAIKNEDAALNIVQNLNEELGAKNALDRATKRAGIRWTLLSAVLYQQMGDSANATKTIEQVLPEFDKMSGIDQETTLRMAGTIYLESKNLPKALDFYQKLIQKSPEDYLSLNNLACILIDGISPPRLIEALEYAKRAYDAMLKTNTLVPKVMDTYGWALVLNGKVDEGIDILRQVTENRPFPDCYYHLAEAYLKKGYGDEAVKQLEAAKKQIEQSQKQLEEAKKHPETATKAGFVDPALSKKIDEAFGRAKESQKAKVEAQVTK